ncbi:MAG: magnesium chelatase [Bacteroidetes bacterium GWF2_43_63]|nr:MAG: magnesium chelatase [Bacteroidetes bacterium GWE2_42_42]OFY55973.1 MAG: magnesium chelatase [Bacteroidetes bacterium GWF2_43_63]HBG71538.1 magnesium chelatase [Bacteroidales bacterium]HCB63010.1 magnesium chelatase [Bacteroidales bacterium]HCY22299.1 magnesium chelatase [Bacteroidales bacterium]
MLVKTYCCAIQGIEAYTVSVEVDIQPGTKTFFAGLPDNAVKESIERIRSALVNNGYRYPGRRVVINLAPADMKKEGSGYDLAISIAVLAASHQIDSERLSEIMIVGELSLDGSLVPVKGVLSAAIEARKNKFKGIVVPAENAHEASVVEGLQVFALHDIRQVVQFLEGTTENLPCPFGYSINEEKGAAYPVDFSDVKGQENVKRVMEIAAAGGHNAIMIGPPGSGKTMLARRLSTILPPMSLDEALETTKIHSVSGKLPQGIGLLKSRPFRAPHHTCSDVALIGGGSYPQPGEISLAHNGVLFLDELPEFKRSALEVMRQPLEDRIVTISRARFTVDYPASVMLIAAMNPCPCGFYNHPEKECTCAPGSIRRYLSRISGPLLDRIDIHIEVTPVPFSSLTDKNKSESSQTVRNRVIAAREFQQSRYQEHGQVTCNAQLTPALMKKHCVLKPEGEQLLQKAMDLLKLSARAYDRILKVARTIADLDNSTCIENQHLAEAIQYRSLDRETWGMM